MLGITNFMVSTWPLLPAGMRNAAPVAGSSAPGSRPMPGAMFSRRKLPIRRVCATHVGAVSVRRNWNVVASGSGVAFACGW